MPPSSTSQATSVVTNSMAITFSDHQPLPRPPSATNGTEATAQRLPALHASRTLTFDMSGGAKLAKRPLDFRSMEGLGDWLTHPTAGFAFEKPEC